MTSLDGLRRDRHDEYLVKNVYPVKHFVQHVVGKVPQMVFRGGGLFSWNSGVHRARLFGGIYFAQTHNDHDNG